MNIKLLIISLVSIIFTIVVNEQNLSYLKGRYPSANNMLTSADEASYFAPVRNFISNNVWKDNSVGFSSFYQRPPAYGFVFYLCTKVNANDPYLILKIIQITLWGLSVFLMGKILSYKIKYSSVLVISLTIIYALLPCFNGFVYYTLTESILPFTVLSLFLLSLKMKESIYLRYLFFGWAGLLLLFRPQLMLIVLGLLTYFFITNKSKLALKNVVVYAIVFISPWLVWSVRNYNLNAEIVGIHPIYHYTNNQMYRPIHQQMTNLFRVWEHNPTIFHQQMASLYADTTENCRVQVYNNISLFKNQDGFKTKVLSVLKKYQHASFQLKNNFSAFEYIPENAIKLESELLLEIDRLLPQLKSHCWMNYYFITPFNSLKTLIVSSHLNLAIFQFKYRGLIWMEVLRWLSFLLLFAGFVSLIINAFGKNIDLWLRIQSTSSLMYLFYLSYFQRLNEDRYFVVILPFIMISLAYLIQKYWLKIKSQNQ